jgi:hypothetical protein
MSKILLRASKTPFDVFARGPVHKNDLKAAYRTMDRLDTKNVGNLIFAHSLYKVLDNPSNVIHIDDFAITHDHDFDAEAERINGSYDIYAIPLSNELRRNNAEGLRRLNANLKKIKIPTVIVGIGAQVGLDLNYGAVDAIKEDIVEFISLVLDRSESIGVRGEFTYDYFRSLGFPADRFDVIGCPSMYYHGENLSVSKPDTLEKIAINLSDVQGSGVESFARYFNKNWRGVSYIPQVRALMPYFWNHRSLDWKKRYAIETEIPNLINTRHTHFLNDVSSWMAFSQKHSFAIGTRIHGNIIPVLAGTPGHVLVHDARTLELARHLDLPYTLLTSIENFDVVKVFEESDYSAMNGGQKGRVANYAKFLQRNGFSHSLYNPEFLQDHHDRVQSALHSGPRPGARTDKIGSFGENFDGKFRFPWQ